MSYRFTETDAVNALRALMEIDKLAEAIDDAGDGGEDNDRIMVITASFAPLFASMEEMECVHGGNPIDCAICYPEEEPEEDISDGVWGDDPMGEWHGRNE